MELPATIVGIHNAPLSVVPSFEPVLLVAQLTKMSGSMALNVAMAMGL